MRAQEAAEGAAPHGETRTTFCRICEALCGLRATVEGGRVVELLPDDEHVATGGFSCVKGLKSHKMYASPDRLRHPLRRAAPAENGASHERVSWDTALAEIGEKVRRIRAESGPDAIAMYVGTAAGFGVLHPIFAQGFMTGVGSRSMYSSATQDCSNKFAVARHVYGFPFVQPFPDVRHTQCLIVVGANPVVSKWSFLQVPNPVQHLRAIEQRGGRIFFVDPRKTESAKIAGEHVFIRPSTDVFFYLSFLHELERQGGVDRARAAQHMTGLGELLAVAAPWPADRTAPVTGIPADKLRDMVTAYRTANGAALYCSTGVNMGGRGALAFWLQEAINAVSGNLDRRGGSLVGRGIVDFAKFGVRTGTLMRDDRSRIGGFASVNDTYAGGLLADEILTPGRGQVRALFVTGGNPLLTMPNGTKLREAFAKLDLLVTLDILPSETGQAAHYQLPCTSPLERPDLPFLFPLFLGLQAKPYLQATRAIVDSVGEERDEATIYHDLARASGVSLFGSRVVQKALDVARWTDARWTAARSAARRDAQAKPSPAYRPIPQEALLSLLLRIGGQGSFDELLARPHGRLRDDHRADDFLGKRVVTKDGRVHLAPAPLLDAARDLEADFQRETLDKKRLRLITRRAVTTHNSWTHNLEDFVAGDRGTNYLYMHPTDAKRAGLSDGDLADVRTDTGTLRVPIKTLADLMEGTVALPHGWGHQKAKGLTVASATRGVNVNLLAPDGAAQLDPLSGMARLTGFPVDVAPAAGPRDPTDWSGL